MKEKKNIDKSAKDEIKDVLYNVLKTLFRFERFEVIKYGLAFQQIFLLKTLKRRDGLKISEVAFEMRMKNFSATRLVDQLESKGLVERIKNSDDKRSIFVRLSRKGKKIVGEIEEHASETVLNNLSEFDQEESESIICVIDKMSKLLDIKNE